MKIKKKKWTVGQMSTLLSMLLYLLGMAGGSSTPVPTEAFHACTGNGQNLIQQLLSPSADSAKTVYRMFVKQVLEDFAVAHGDWLVHPSKRVTGAFEAEAERWVQRMWSVPMPNEQVGHSSSVNSSGISNSSGIRNSSSNSSNSSMARSSTNSSSVNGSDAAEGRPVLSCLGGLYQMLLQKHDPAPPSFVSQPPRTRDNGLVLLSGGDRVAALTERLVANHAAFARRHGYTQWWRKGSLVSARGWQPYWHKVAMLRSARSRFPNASAFVWVDDDIVLTNHAQDMFRGALRRSPADVLVTRDPSRAATLNTGIVIVRNTAGGARVLDELWRRASAPRGDAVSLAKDGQSHCLHEQQALQEMYQSGRWRGYALIREITELSCL